MYVKSVAGVSGYHSFLHPRYCLSPHVRDALTLCLRRRHLRTMFYQHVQDLASILLICIEDVRLLFGATLHFDQLLQHCLMLNGKAIQDRVSFWVNWLVHVYSRMENMAHEFWFHLAHSVTK